jgi:hypothetical protein
MTMPIKISKENYEWLCRLSGELRRQLQRPVSIDEALSHLQQKRVSDLAGAWMMDDKEEEGFLRGLREGWKRWKTGSA